MKEDFLKLQIIAKELKLSDQASAYLAFLSLNNENKENFLLNLQNIKLSNQTREDLIS